MKKLVRFLKFIPLILVGIAVIVWGILFQRNHEKKGMPATDEKGQPIFPY